MADETSLTGGRVTAGVVRLDDTVRRPTGPHSTFVHALLRHLQTAGFERAPQLLGTDDKGREILTFMDGTVPPDLDADLSDEVLVAAARLIRRYHDATADSPLSRSAEVVCHNDLSPCNCVFVNGLPWGLIDFDEAAPGSRIRDVSYAIFLWLNLGTDGPKPREQSRRITLWCDAYETGHGSELITAIQHRIREGVERQQRRRQTGAARWWADQLAWVTNHARELSPE